MACSPRSTVQRARSPARVHCAKVPRGIGVELTVGLHTGEVELRADGDVTGIAVHIAARVLAAAQPGQVLVSSAVPPLVSGSGIAFTDLGPHELKGVSGEWSLFAVDG